MKKIMIVDDEMLVRIGIKSIIDWESNGYTIVAEAIDGTDALAKIPLFQPDILLTDLVMEPMDGLELIRICRERFPSIRIVALSNYNDFEHVKKAMKLGAKDFLFKLTTSAEQLLPILDSVSGESENHEPLTNDQSRLVERNISAIKQKLGRMLADHAFTSEKELQQELAFIGISCDFTKPYALMYLNIADYELIRSQAGEELPLLASSLEHTVTETMGGVAPFDIFQIENHACLIAIGADRDPISRTLVGKLGVTFKRIHAHVRQYFGMQLCGSLSMTHCTVGSFHEAVQECRAFLQYAFLYKEQKLLTNEDCEGSKAEIALPSPLAVEHWQRALISFQFDEAQGFLDHTFDWLFNLQKERILTFMVREHLHMLYRILKNEGQRLTITVDHLTDGYQQSLYQAIANFDLLGDIEESFHAIFQQYCEQCLSSRVCSLHEKITKAIVYIDEHLQDRLGLETIAAQVNMSESYFSHLFKQTVGISFIEYLNDARIKRAQTLLTSTDLKINEIAALVGIQNPNYFSILFKKLRGISPIEYRGGS